MTLEARNLTFRYPRRGSAPPLEGVNLTLRSGERLGLSAPSGRGKTTLCKVLAGWERPEKGEVLLDGAPCPASGGSARCSCCGSTRRRWWTRCSP